ncbi:unnamed protein product [Didymodactylos carnosus]|nr:unnamed protein product [Didymodactylos carnosus]CAF3803977.1 unnamed protein product [Didymodactylos carnosus]
MFDRSSFSIWTVIKSCVGKDLTKFSIPVIWNEPLSFIQRLAEQFEYSDLLDQAANYHSEQTEERLHLITAFLISNMSANLERISKPFNPILGETYELQVKDGEDNVKFHYVAEQVSHHPPISVYYCKGKQWILTSTVQPKVKFHGTSVEAIPDGCWILKIKKSAPKGSNLTVETTNGTLKHSNSSGSFHSCNDESSTQEQVEQDSEYDVYTCYSPSLTVHNVIFGKLWCEFHGQIDIHDHTNGTRAVVQLKSAYSWFTTSKHDLYKFDGYMSKGTTKLSAFHGNYGHCYYRINDLNDYTTPHSRNNTSSKKCDIGGHNVLWMNNSSLTPSPCDVNLYKSSRLVWYRNLRMTQDELKDRSRYYYFTHFTYCLNQEIEESTTIKLPRTDSRFRQDVRQLELGNLELSSAEKHRLEEKQRQQHRNSRHMSSSDTSTVVIQSTVGWRPLWFDLVPNIYSSNKDEQMWKFNGNYFKRNFDKCPDLF